jgi:ubiquinone/menaquinone biosynthesis C-methylase UbiE
MPTGCLQTKKITLMGVKYDKIGTGYNLTPKVAKYLTEQLFHHLKPSKNGKYLDIGCRTGNYTNTLQKSGFQLIGIDPSKQMLENAKLKNNEIDWKIG